MTLASLKEAIERYVKVRDGLASLDEVYGEPGDGWPSNQKKGTIADHVRDGFAVASAFASTAPIDRGMLERWGWHYGGRAWGCTWSLNGCELHMTDDGSALDVIFTPDGRTVNPTPRTERDLVWLLLRLEGE